MIPPLGGIREVKPGLTTVLPSAHIPWSDGELTWNQVWVKSGLWSSNHKTPGIYLPFLRMLVWVFQIINGERDMQRQKETHTERKGWGLLYK